MTRPNDHPSALVANLEARMGARLAAGLNERAAHVPHDIAERLRVAREQAVLRSGQPAVAPSASAAGVSGWGWRRGCRWPS
jgi:hypothetical protein